MGSESAVVAIPWGIGPEKLRLCFLQESELQSGSLIFALEQVLWLRP